MVSYPTPYSHMQNKVAYSDFSVLIFSTTDFNKTPNGIYIFLFLSILQILMLKFYCH